MHRRFLGTILLATGLVLLTAPAALAGTTQTTNTLTTTVTTPTVSDAHRYQLELDQGESLDLMLTWNHPDADLDLAVTAPGGTCQVAPNPEVFCLAEGAVETASGATCQDQREGQHLGFGPGTETLSFTADTSGTHSIWVLASLAPPLAAVNYDLTVTTSDDGDSSLSDPDPFNLIRTDGHCRGL